MVGVELEDAFRRRHLLPAVSQQSLELRAHVVLTADETRRRGREPTRQTNLFDVLLEVILDLLEQRLEALRLLLELLARRFPLLFASELRSALGGRPQGLAVVLGNELHEQLVDRVVEIKHLVPARLESLQMG